MKLNLHAESRHPDSWDARLRACQTSLDDNPNSPQAWHWRVQVRILKFLLSRYGSNVAVQAEPQRPANRRSFPPLVLPDNTRLPKAAHVLKRILAHIAEGNRNKPAASHPAAGINKIKSNVWADPETSGFARLMLTDISPARKIPWLHRWLRCYIVFNRHFPDAAMWLLIIFLGAVFFGVCLLVSYLGYWK